MFARSAAAGFTLIEVLVAFAIAGLALILLFRAGGDGLFAVDTAARAEQALERAQSHLAALGRDAALLQGDFEGDDGGGYHWRLHVTPVASWPSPSAIGVSGPATLFDVEVAISWAGRLHDRKVVLQTRRLAVTSAGSADR